MNYRYKKNHRNICLNQYSNSFSDRYTCRLRYGLYGITVSKAIFLHYTQVNAIRIRISRLLKKISKQFFKIYLRVFFTIGITKKPALTRMGKGSGQIKGWFSILRQGNILMEVNIIGFSFILKRVLVKVRNFVPCNISFLRRLS